MKSKIKIIKAGTLYRLDQKLKFLKLATTNITTRGDYLDVAFKNGFNILYSDEKKPLVSGPGLEPGTHGLKGRCSTN